MLISKEIMMISINELIKNKVGLAFFVNVFCLLINNIKNIFCHPILLLNTSSGLSVYFNYLFVFDSKITIIILGTNQIYQSMTQ
jgi:hypothetical protein